MSRVSYYLEMIRRTRPQRMAPKAWNYAKYRLLPKYPETSVERYAPQIATVLLTKRCNLSCSYCAAGKIMEEGRKNWRGDEGDLESVKRIFENPLFANCVFVDLLGGEPLLVKDLEAIVGFLSERGHLTNISTNGIYLERRIEGLASAGISRINVSLNDENEAVLRRDLAKINQVFRVHTSQVLLKSAVEGQADRLLEMARFVRDAGCASLRFWIYRAMGTDPNPAEVLVDDDPAYVRFRRRVDEALPGFCEWPAAVKPGPIKKRCPQLWQRISVDISGAVYVCCGLEETLTGPDSRLFDTAPDVLWNHPKLVEMRRGLLAPNAEPPEECRGCNMLDDPGW